MELIKKQPAQNLNLVTTSRSKNVDYTKTGIIISNNTITRQNGQAVSKQQTCFKLKVVNSPAMAKMFL